MKFLGRTTQPEDIDQCIESLRDRFLYSDEELKHLRSLWVSLLSRDIARSAVVFNDAEPRRVLAFGISAPLRQSRFDEILRDRGAYITKGLLEEWRSGREPFLDEREYAASNASMGLNILVMNNAISETLDASLIPSMLSMLTETFLSQHVGCRIKAVAHESFGIPAEFAIDLGAQVIEYARPPKPGLPDRPVNRTPSHIIVATREHAEQRPGNLTMNALFLRFIPPLFALSTVQRRLLRFCRRG